MPTSPQDGYEQEFLIDLIKQLHNLETCIDKAREKLILRCPEFDNKKALKLFSPPDDPEENLHAFNIKKAFKRVNIALDTNMAKMLLKRFDSNYDEELSHSDAVDFFKPNSLALQKELERRTVFGKKTQSPENESKGKLSK